LTNGELDDDDDDDAVAATAKDRRSSTGVNKNLFGVWAKAPMQIVARALPRNGSTMPVNGRRSEVVMRTRKLVSWEPVGLEGSEDGLFSVPRLPTDVRHAEATDNVEARIPQRHFMHPE